MNRSTFLDELGLQRPVIQAGMAGGVARGELAGAVSAAGGLGTVGMMGPSAFAQALAEARRRAGNRPVAANLLVPFIKRAHIECVAGNAALVVLHGGISRRWTSALRQRGARVFITVGTREQAIRALAAGAQGLVVQGIEAGGHLVGTEPVTSALPRILEVADDLPVLAAGGVAEAADVSRLLGIGAVAAIAGTRFLLTEEAAAHPQYKQRVLQAQRTLATQLFGLGWPLLHRVVANAATERWCRKSELGPFYARLLARASAPVARLTPLQAMGRLAAWQRPALPFFTPALALEGMPDSAVDHTALYAGETAARLHELLSAEEAVARLRPQ